jgi:chemotaxis signal transduction protein
MGTVQVRVRVAGEQYAMPVAQVAEVVPYAGVTSVPGAPDAVLGLHNLRGEILTVIDPAPALGLRDRGRPSRLIVAADEDRTVCLAVDEVLGIDPLPEGSPEHGLGCIRATAIVDGALVGLLDVGALLDSVAGDAT